MADSIQPQNTDISQSSHQDNTSKVEFSGDSHPSETYQDMDASDFQGAEMHNPDIETNKEIAGISYLPFICFLVLVFRKDSPFIQENAKQGTGLFVMLLVSLVLLIIPIVKIVAILLLVLYLVFIILGVKTAFEGRTIHIPILSKYMKTHDLEMMAKKIVQSPDIDTHKQDVQSAQQNQKQKSDINTPSTSS